MLAQLFPFMDFISNLRGDGSSRTAAYYQLVHPDPHSVPTETSNSFGKTGYSLDPSTIRLQLPRCPHALPKRPLSASHLLRFGRPSRRWIWVQILVAHLLLHMPLCSDDRALPRPSESRHIPVQDSEYPGCCQKEGLHSKGMERGSWEPVALERFNVNT